MITSILIGEDGRAYLVRNGSNESENVQRVTVELARDAFGVLRVESLVLHDTIPPPPVPVAGA